VAEPDRHPDLRASDAERQRVVDELRRHFGDGRLTLGEFEERSGQAYGARTVGDLTPLLADLPALDAARPSGPPARVGEPRPSAELRGYFRFWVALSAMFVLIWALAGGGYFWPVWPMFGTGVPMLFMLAARR
jgi:hypothetical protein